MIVVLIGPDKSGKSTLAQKLQDHYGWGIYKGTPIADKTEMVRRVVQVVKDHLGSNLICDRLQYPEDLIYSPIIEKEPSVFEPIRDKMEAALTLADTLVVLVSAEPNTLKKRYEEDGDGTKRDYICINNLEDIFYGYQAFVDETNLDLIVANTAGSTSQEAFDFVKKHIDRRLDASSSDITDGLFRPDSR